MDLTKEDRWTIPRNAAMRFDHPFPNPNTDPPIAEHGRDDRITARHLGNSAIVPVPRRCLPVTIDTPQFLNYGTVTSQTSVDAIEDCLDAVEAYLGADTRPSDCFYSVRCNSIQLSSNTPARFIEDLRTIEPIATAVATDTSSNHFRNPPAGRLGSCFWPTDEGWFYLEAREHESASAFGIFYGLLRRGPPLDPSTITAFFEAVFDGSPPLPSYWSKQLSTCSGSRSHCLQAVDPLGDQYVSHPERRLPSASYSGANPIFGIEPPETGDRKARISHPPHFMALRRVSRLPFEKEMDCDPDQTALDHITAMALPTEWTLIVVAQVERASGSAY